ncbi:hypothetical protein LJC60_05250 [Ruminococcaceae bacterium OttesenSCG-928-D13]|nr:hypothetical protein [Ruminococcaceae bacterium OttesenSCG-928-D13]
MPLTYQQEFNASYFECDPWDRMTPGAALRRIQEIATDQCEGLGIDPPFYARTHTAFVLSRMSLITHEMPRAKQPVQMETRAWGMRRAVYHRVTSMYDTGGRLLCEADTRWVLIDTETRRILRRPLPEFLEFFSEDPVYDEHPMQLPKCADYAQSAGMQARLSLCDRNGHLNNTRYADLMLDCLPAEKLEAGPPKRMLFYYHNEIPQGSDFELRWNLSDRCANFVATDGKSKNFEGFLGFDD